VRSGVCFFVFDVSVRESKRGAERERAEGG
jgi:hypothetical protein